MLLYFASVQSVSVDLYETATIDGAGPLKRMWHVTRPAMEGIILLQLVRQTISVFQIMEQPLAIPVIIYESINVLSAAWSDFFTSLLVLDKNAVVPLKVYRLQTDTRIQMNTYFMALVFALIPPFINFAFFQKRILGGINVGGVKG